MQPPTRRSPPRSRLASSALLVVCLQGSGGPSLPPTGGALQAPAPVAAKERQHTMARAPLPSLADIAKLPPDGGPEFNRLIFASSPYLLQHARNPVDWYPWGPVAFEHARATAKPIFLSIGYSTCHWCHVMEHESFEDAEVAKLLNEYFVCVKVDREERPDVDAVYMTVTQGMTGSGGWPMTVFLTPEREPFFAATYIPKHSVGERSGMLELVPEVGLAWRAEREKLVTTGRSATEWLRKRMRQPDGVELNAEVLQRAEQGLASSYDAQWGGFGSAPKFPTPHNLRLLLRRWNRSGDQRSLDMVLATLRSMRAGGIWDHVGFGFHRYSTDRQWLLPHFEKMLCDQASIALAYVEAWQVSGAADLRRTAEEIFAYVLRDMTAPEGGFYSAEDADSEGEEGRFHTWTRAEITSALGAEDAAFAAEVWDVRDSGNFTEQSTGRANGRNVLHLPADVATIAKRKGVPPSELEARVEAVRARLFAGREKRVHPLKDDKILTDWNGLMIAALAHGGRAFGEARYVEAASRAAEFVLTRLRSADGRLKKSLRAGSASGAAVHDDYAFLVWGLLELHETTGDPRWLKTSLELVELERVLFADAASGGFFLSAHDTEHLIARPKTAQDGALPSGNSVSALNHLRLARLTGRTELEQRANQSLRAFGAAIRQTPEAHTQFLTALDFVQGPSFELVVAGPAGSTEMQSVLARIHRVFAPHKVVLVKPDGDAGKAVSELAPYTASQLSLESKPTVYLCRSFTCELPTHDVASVIEKLRPSQKK